MGQGSVPGDAGGGSSRRAGVTRRRSASRAVRCTASAAARRATSARISWSVGMTVRGGGAGGGVARSTRLSPSAATAAESAAGMSSSLRNFPLVSTSRAGNTPGWGAATASTSDHATRRRSRPGRRIPERSMTVVGRNWSQAELTRAAAITNRLRHCPEMSAQTTATPMKRTRNLVARTDSWTLRPTICPGPGPGPVSLTAATVPPGPQRTSRWPAALLHQSPQPTEARSGSA